LASFATSFLVGRYIALASAADAITVSR